MLEKKLLFISLITILVLALLHFFALKFSWYFIYRWLDTPMHILGGFWVSITSFWISLKVKHLETIVIYKKKAFLIMFISVLFVGILWEIFESLSHNTSYLLPYYWWDTLTDIACGFIGGIVAYIYFLKAKKYNHNSIII